VGYWRLDEGSGTVIKDYSGSNKDLTAYNSPE